jgi:Na+-driven multidrug efflux pump
MFVTGGVLRGAGDTLTQMFITLAVLWVIRIPVSAFLSKHIGYTGIWWGMPAGWILGTIANLYYYFSGKWKRKAIVQPAYSPIE